MIILLFNFICETFTNHTSLNFKFFNNLKIIIFHSFDNNILRNYFLSNLETSYYLDFNILTSYFSFFVINS
jgi:hypothetical protein